MKAKEAPEKIYLHKKEIGTSFSLWPIDDGIEYARTDAFIEKACAWLKNNLQGVVGGSIYIDDFRKYMEEE